MARRRRTLPELPALRAATVAAAERLDSLREQFRARRLDVHIARLQQRGRERLADLGEASRTLRCYAGFLSLVISAEKRTLENRAPKKPAPAAVAELGRSLIAERARAKGKRLMRPRKFADGARIAALRAEGRSWPQIASQLGVGGVGTAYRTCLSFSKNLLSSLPANR